MSTPTKVVLLACGSFNPVTNMHLRMFELARDALHRTGQYTVVGGLMSPVGDAYEKKDLMQAKHRCAMLKLALKNNTWVKMDTWEAEQPKWLETAKVCAHHKSRLENECQSTTHPAPTKKRRKDLRNERVNEDEIDSKIPKISTSIKDHVKLKLLCGADLLESFGTPGLWKDEDIEEIVSKYGLVCITRAGSDPRKFIYESDVLYKNQDNIFIVTEWIHNDVSSTKIRRALRRGESIKYLVQDSVINYIKEHGLYSVPDNKYINDLVPTPTDDIISMDMIDGSDLPDVTIAKQPLNNPRQLIEDSTPPRSPKRMMEPDPFECPRSPKSPRHVPCMTDIGTLVRRVRNVRIAYMYTPETCV